MERGVYVGCEFNNPTLDTDDELEECMEDLGKLQISGKALCHVILGVTIRGESQLIGNSLYIPYDFRQKIRLYIVTVNK